MPQSFRGALTRATALSSSDINDIYNAACTSCEPPATLTALACLVPCSVEALSQLRIEHVDRFQGLIRVKGPAGNVIEVVLGFAAALIVDIAADGRTHGWLFDGGRGEPMLPDEEALDYAKEIIVSSGRHARIDWDWADLRDAIFHDMTEFGVPMDAAIAQAGLSHDADVSDQDAHFRQRAAADWWSYRLGLEPPSAFAYAATVISTAGRQAITDRRAGGEA